MSRIHLYVAAGVYLVMGALSGGLNVLDKWRAVRSRDKKTAKVARVSERTLHVLDLLGGILGGTLARSLVRHKTRKSPFKWVSRVILTLHAGGWLVAIGAAQGWF